MFKVLVNQSINPDFSKIITRIMLCLFRELLGSPNRWNTAITSFGDKKEKKKAIYETGNSGETPNP